VAYGFLFGVYPSLVAETFGVHGLSQNWGCMTLAPVISGNIFNLLYGMSSNPSSPRPYSLKSADGKQVPYTTVTPRFFLVASVIALKA